MKRRLFLVFFLSFILFVGCCYDDIYTILSRNIAEKRVSLAVGRVDIVSSSLMCGYREEEYILNGSSTDLIEFGVLSFSIDGFDALDFRSATYILNVGMDRFSGELELNPFDYSLVVDIGKIVDMSEKIEASISVNGQNYSIKLEAISTTWAVDSDKVLHTFASTYKKELKKYIHKGTLNGELYIKTLYDPDIDDYYWYVNFITNEGSSISVIMDKNNGQILVDKVNIL